MSTASPKKDDMSQKLGSLKDSYKKSQAGESQGGKSRDASPDSVKKSMAKNDSQASLKKSTGGNDPSLRKSTGGNDVASKSNLKQSQQNPLPSDGKAPSPRQSQSPDARKSLDKSRMSNNSAVKNSQDSVKKSVK